MTISGQITVATAGTAVQGPAVPAYVNATFAIKPHPTNTGAVWVGNVDGDVSSTNGFPLAVGEGIVLTVERLDQLWFDADTNGDIICWVLL